jgi:hypothetical protein
MKKLFSATLCAAMIVWAGSAMALPTIWTDNIETDRYIGNGVNYSYIHDITDGVGGFQGLFMPGTGNDIVFSYDLSIGLKDDHDGIWEFLPEFIFIDQPGIIGDRATFSLSNQALDWSLAGLIDLNQSGKLGVTITSIVGDFYIDYSRLTVQGDNGPVPVPEPTTMLLLGTGLAGLASVARRRKATKGRLLQV